MLDKGLGCKDLEKKWAKMKGLLRMNCLEVIDLSVEIGFVVKKNGLVN